MKKGFSLIETLIVTFLLVLVLSTIYALFVLNQRAYERGEASTELNQNGRVIIERLTRELRQARAFATTLPILESLATDTLEFQDGHDPSFIRYIEYSLNNADNTVERTFLAYYFSGNPGTYVVWDAVPPPGQTKEILVLDGPEIIGEYVEDLNFWSSSGANISVYLQRGNNSLEVRSKVFPRNI